jgi:hypothetical protein
MDWRSLSEVKELGLYLQNCSCLAIDLEKIFYTMKYISLDLNSSLIEFEGYPQETETLINENNRIVVNDVGKKIY